MHSVASLVVGIVLLGAGATAQAVEIGARLGALTMRCTNPVSGTKWLIKIDYRHSTVDSHRARIDDDEITWHDPREGGQYTLDRKTGILAFVAASSTGGYFLWDRCLQEKLR